MTCLHYWVLGCYIGDSLSLFLHCKMTTNPSSSSCHRWQYLSGRIISYVNVSIVSKGRQIMLCRIQCYAFRSNLLASLWSHSPVHCIPEDTHSHTWYLLKMTWYLLSLLLATLPQLWSSSDSKFRTVFWKNNSKDATGLCRDIKVLLASTLTKYN